MCPETGDQTAGRLTPERGASGSMEAITRGTIDALHLLLNIIAMLLVAVAGLECFALKPRLELFTHWACGVRIVGGMIFGPLVLINAFGVWWTGWPVGGDITDNKTLVGLAGWLIALFAVHRMAKPRA